MCTRPMLARIGSRSDLDRDGFLFEPKVDGIRATCEKDGELTFFNRSCRNVSARYPEFDFADALEADTCVLDGEIVQYDQSGNPNFTALMQRHLGTGPVYVRDRALRFVAFDILGKNGRDLKQLPLVERKRILEETIRKHPHLELVVFTEDGHRLWEFVRRRSLEGVVAKKMSSLYLPGSRTRDWLKIKAFDTLDAVIVGYSSERRAVSALALGAYEGDRLRFIGKVGTGMSEKDIRAVRKLLEPLEIEEPPLEIPDAYSGIQWVEPRHVCEVRYLEFGTQGMLRNPAFLRLRPDKAPADCRLDVQSG